ncbi:MAG: hypothetical protein V4622_11645 [Bacteroidota bacterium]
MKTKFNLVCLTFLLLTQFVVAQAPIQNPVQDISLVIESSDGNNGLGVAFNPEKNIYYSVFAGNMHYPIEVHNTTGKSIFSAEIGGDLRGFWYNPAQKCLEGILYNNEGSGKFYLDNSGFPLQINSESFAYGMEANDVACFNKGKVYILGSGGISVFKAGKKKSKLIKNTDLYSNYDMYNTRSIFHTGIKGYELGVFNHADSKVVLINEKTGKTVSEIAISLDGYYEGIENFNISYANNHIFFFNKENREWNGYKIF